MRVRPHARAVHQIARELAQVDIPVGVAQYPLAVHHVVFELALEAAPIRVHALAQSVPQPRYVDALVRAADLLTPTELALALLAAFRKLSLVSVTVAHSNKQCPFCLPRFHEPSHLSPLA